MTAKTKGKALRMYTSMKLIGRWYGFRKDGAVTLSNKIDHYDTEYLVIDGGVIIGGVYVRGQIIRALYTQPEEYYKHRGISLDVMHS